MSCQGCHDCQAFEGQGPDCDYCGCDINLHGANGNKPAGICKFPNCHMKVFIDPTGRVSEFCTLRHRDQFQPNTSPIPVKQCKFPGCLLAVYVDPNTGASSEFCRLTHRDQYRAMTSNKRCRLPNCNNDVYLDSFSGKVAAFCTLSHRDQYKSNPPGGKAIPLCKLSDCYNDCHFDKKRGAYSDYCGAGHRDQANVNSPGFWPAGSVDHTKYGIVYSKTTDPLLKPVDLNSHDGKSLTAQFIGKWVEGAVPKVIAILAIAPLQSVVDKFETYRQKVMKDNPKIYGSGSEGNTHRRFHGTGKIQCDLGYKTNTPKICGQADCAVCSIVKTSLQKKFSPGGQFGPGLYLTSTSSKSHWFNGNTSTTLGPKTRGMFLCHIVIGKGMKYNTNQPNLTAPPKNFHSVFGEPGTGQVNFDEVVVYDDDAVCPAYYIIYQEA